MSADLDVRLNSELSIIQVVRESELVLRSLLGLTQTPQLSVVGEQLGERFAVSADAYIPGDDGYLIGLRDTEDEVALVTFELKPQPPYISESEAGQRAGIIVGAMKSQVEWAIAASIAITLADKSQTQVEDSGHLWTDIEAQSASDFAHKITVAGTYDDIVVAAAVFYSNLARKRYEES